MPLGINYPVDLAITGYEVNPRLPVEDIRELNAQMCAWYEDTTEAPDSLPVHMSIIEDDAALFEYLHPEGF